MNRLVIALVIFLLSLSAYASERQTWVVKKGDTLTGILSSLNRMKPPIQTAHIKEWNPDLGTAIYVGQKIYYYIPATPIPKAAATPADIVNANAPLQSSVDKVAAMLVTIIMTVKTFAIFGLVAVGLIVGVIAWASRRPTKTTTVQPKIMIIRESSADNQKPITSIEPALVNLAKPDLWLYINTHRDMTSFKVEYTFEEKRVAAMLAKSDAGTWSATFNGFPNVPACGVDKVQKVAMRLLSSAEALGEAVGI